MTNYSSGHQAEKRASKYLADSGYKLRQLNWSTPTCEIDIVAERGDSIYFVEVKYRSTDDQGSGLDYITPAKLRQMEYAATTWCLENDYHGDYELSAIELKKDFEISEFIPRLT